MRIDSSQVSLASAYSFQAEQQFSGTYTAAATNGNASNNASPSSDVQISTAGQQAAANDPGNLNSVISPQMSIFKSMLEQMLGTSIQSMQFTGDISEEAQSGNAAQVTQQGNNTQGASVSYAAEAIQLNAKGTLTTSDGRTLSFSADMSLLQVATSATLASSTSGTSQQTGSPTAFDTSGWPSLAVSSPQQSTGATGTSAPANNSNANANTNAGTGTLIPASAAQSGIVHFVISLNQMLLQQMSEWLQDRGANHTLPASTPTTTSQTSHAVDSASNANPAASASTSIAAYTAATHGSKTHGGHRHQHQGQSPTEAVNVSI